MKKIFLLVIFFPLFAFSSESEILKLANELKIYDKAEWKALLHYNRNLDIDDKNFVSIEKFSLKNELESTIISFYNSKNKYQNVNEHPQCKFPARLLFITHELNITKDEFPKVECEELNQYKNKAPADTIYLIYASENVKNPSSMMGHTFFKYSGKNYQNQNVEHAITFYTILNSFNLLTLAYQNTVSGMDGFFALQPYKEVVAQYLYRENRNVWEYQLELSEYRRKLINYHIWELKDIHMRYFFASYNCSTVVYYILSLAEPKIYDKKKLWITPLDTVKYLYDEELIKNSKLIPSTEWFIKMLEENIDSNDVNNVKEIVSKSQYNEIEKLDFLSLELLKNYSLLEHKKKNIDNVKFAAINSHMENISNKDKKFFDISNYKSPYKIPNQRQFGVSYKSVEDKDFLKLSFLGASHLLSDDNREYFGESELKIADLSLLVNEGGIKLENFTLYGMKSYIPFDTLTNDISYEFEMAVKREYDENMQYKNIFKINGGIGFDFLLSKDINIFAVFNTGIGYNEASKMHIVTNPKFGMMIYEILNMKTLFSYKPMFVNDNKIYNNYSLEQNLFFSKKYKIYFNVDIFDNKKKYVNCEIGLRKLF